MVVGVVARYVEAVRISEHRRIAIGGTQQHRDYLIGANVLTGNTGVAMGLPAGVLHRRIETQDLLDCVAPSFELGPQQSELVEVYGEPGRARTSSLSDIEAESSRCRCPRRPG
jgi:hypothetical protein